MTKLNANYFLRHFEAWFLLETLLVFAVASALVMRGSLLLLGYPQIATGDLHIAHVLFGGLFMLIALVIAIVFLNKETRYVAAAVGGVGFGLFIDELGKFITHDNDYFYQPAFALIYLTFIGMFFSFRFVAHAFAPSRNELLFNALELLKESVIHEMDQLEKAAALKMLSQVEGDHQMVSKLRRVIEDIKPRLGRERHWWYRTRETVLQSYLTLVARKKLMQVVVAIFGLLTLGQVGLSAWYLHLSRGFWQVGLMAASLLAAVAILAGGWMMLRKQLLSGYEYLKQGALISLLVVRFFQLNITVPLALGGILLDVLIIGVINYGLSLEAGRQEQVYDSRIVQFFKRVVKLMIERPLNQRVLP